MSKLHKQSKNGNRGVSTSKTPTRAEKYAAALLAGNTKQEARRLAGYSTKAHQHPESMVQKRAIVSAAQERGLLRMQPGYTMADSAGIYNTISRSKEVDPDARVRARARLDAIMGHDAPKVIDNNQPVMPGITQVLALIQLMDPSQLTRLNQLPQQ
jgi:hypothetical protein